MSQKFKRQASFSRLAAGQVASRRSDIMLAATDTFCSQPRPDKAQVDQFRELFYSLIGKSDEAAKRLIASALAKHYYTPRQVLLYLALEDAAIAAPVLAYSKALGQFDLLQIIDKTSNLHHRVIANRDDLGKTVVSKLLELDDYLVRRRLEDNPAVDTSQLLPEKTLPEDVFDAPQTSSNQQKTRSALAEMDEILHGISPASPAKDNAPADNKIKLAMDELISLANRGRRLGSVDDLLTETPVDAGLSFSDQLLQATTRKNRQDQVAAIRSEFHLTADAANAVFEDHSGDTMAVCLKAADVRADVALQIVSQSIPNVGLSTHNTERLEKIYPALNMRACMETVKTWSQTTKPDATGYAPTTADVENRDTRRSSTPEAASGSVLYPRLRKLFGT